MVQTGIALVTGANKGIGLEVVRQLAQRGWQVFLTARQRQAGEKAAAGIAGKVEFLELDVTKEASIAKAAKELSKRVDYLDVLVNNAGILDKKKDESILEISSDLLLGTLTTNTLGPLLVARAFVPLLSKSRAPRIINVSSTGGQLSTMETWAPAYSISKTALNAVTRQLSGALPAIAVNSVCPGWVRTDMGGSTAPRSVEQGANTIVWLATEAPQKLTGKFLSERKPIDW